MGGLPCGEPDVRSGRPEVKCAVVLRSCCNQHNAATCLHWMCLLSFTSLKGRGPGGDAHFFRRLFPPAFSSAFTQPPPTLCERTHPGPPSCASLPVGSSSLEASELIEERENSRSSGRKDRCRRRWVSLLLKKPSYPYQRHGVRL